MARQIDPWVSRRLLSRRLLALRHRAERTQLDVADAMHWSASKLNRIETVSVGISVSDTKGLLREYGAEDDESAMLVELADDARRRPWHAAFRDVILMPQRQLFAFESSAVAIHQFDLMVIPSVLQTLAYARALLGVIYPADRLDQVVEARMEHQRRILDDPPQLRMIIDEYALGRTFAGSVVMADQLAHLIALADHPRVSISVVPKSAGGHIGVAGSFGLLQVPGHGTVETVLYLAERPEYLAICDEEVITSYYLCRFNDIEKEAKSGEGAKACFVRALRQLELR